MSYELIITEKPSSAKKIAESLADGKAIKEASAGVSIFKITHAGKDLVVASAVGHLFSVAEKKKGFTYPSYDIHWVPSSEVDKTATFSKKYLTVLKKLSKDAKSFTVACDYDIEGEVIGLNIVRFVCGQKDAARMKFSTLTKDELQESYAKKSPTLDWGQAYAGETRHFLDWIYGINLSRALMTAVKTAGSFKVLSSGRVQGPALKIIVDKEREIQAFVSKHYWQVELTSKKNSQDVVSLHVQEKFWDESLAQSVMSRCKGKDALVKSLDKKQMQQAPPNPFDLGSLQTESYRLFGISPKQTLQIAQNLYLEGVTSYPRTSSQQLPPSLGFAKILQGLAKQYPSQVKIVLAGPLKPNNGKKTDPAHPAIYPTGLVFKGKNDQELKVYDLVVKRFLATFGAPATRQTITAVLNIAADDFVSKGTTTVVSGWHELYEPYVRLQEQSIPALIVGEELKTVALELQAKQTQAPKRYTASSIISELEKRGLGTKATRADIVDSLYRRGYVDEKSIMANELGVRTIETLEKYCPEILDEELTRSFEVEMDLIRQGQKAPEDVLAHARTTLDKILLHFKKSEKDIGDMLISAHRESEDVKNTLGACPVCKEGFLKIMYSRKTRKKFVGCSRYPDCSTSAPISAGAIIKSTEKVCEHDGWPIIKVLRRGKVPQELCLNMDCVTKQSVASRAMDGKPCPLCGKPLGVRKSIYGEFVGCSDYPKCKHTGNGN